MFFGFWFSLSLSLIFTYSCKVSKSMLHNTCINNTAANERGVTSKHAIPSWSIPSFLTLFLTDSILNKNLGEVSQNLSFFGGSEISGIQIGCTAIDFLCEVWMKFYIKMKKLEWSKIYPKCLSKNLIHIYVPWALFEIV